MKQLPPHAGPSIVDWRRAGKDPKHDAETTGWPRLHRPDDDNRNRRSFNFFPLLFFGSGVAI
jgi:hypothetical protein